ncbi:hypothetical protein [Sinorhizobium meliloti]|uniref:hypothetical protein n=1 Tax=Rhizobium meliloti TaxID=382 RepID=UPI001295387E|nr:hypothetical protein [Sinorhizobium meliloti]MQX59921.1 hypothetical protein [Sinorhizobium meliloti]
MRVKTSLLRQPPAGLALLLTLLVPERMLAEPVASPNYPLLPATEVCPRDHQLTQLTGDRSWLPSEIWAWERLCVGSVADFASASNRPASCPPQAPDGQHSRITNRFLQAVLNFHPLVIVTPLQGVQIKCAYFGERIDISETHTDHPLYIEESTFSEGLEAINFRSSTDLSFDGSLFLGSLIMDRARVEGTVYINNTRFDLRSVTQRTCHSTAAPCAIQAIGAAVGKDLSLTNAISDGNVNVGGVNVGGDFKLFGGRFGKIDAMGSRIGGDIHTCGDISGCRDVTTLEYLSVAGSQISGSILLNSTSFTGGGYEGTKDISLNMTKTSVGNELQLRYASLNMGLGGNALNVGGDTRTRDARFGNVTLVGSCFQGSLDFSGSTFDGALNLSNGKVRNSLIFQYPTADGIPANWTGSDGALVLTNATVGSLQDWGGAKENRYIYKDLKGRLNINNFSYGQFGLIDPSVASSQQDILPLNATERIEQWLAMQKGYESSPQPQPFNQLAKTFANLGLIDDARTVEIASRNQMLTASQTPWTQKVLLFLQWIFIAYGYNPWISLAWLALLVVTGAIMANKTRKGREFPLSNKLWLSLDLALPIITLDDAHDKMDLSGARAYFYIHRLFGFLLASFLVAGISGLTK